MHHFTVLNPYDKCSGNRRAKCAGFSLEASKGDFLRFLNIFWTIFALVFNVHYFIFFFSLHIFAHFFFQSKKTPFDLCKTASL